MKAFKKILIIIQRSNGDVLLSQTLINSLYTNYDSPQIDLLVNDDTVYCASLLTNVNFIHTFSYSKKSENRWKQEIDIFKALNRKYELSINLTASDRSVLYALIASKNSISAIEKEKSKSFWKRILLTHHYFFDTDKHILLNNLEPLNILKIKHQKILSSPKLSNIVIKKLKNRLEKMGITDFIIFHPSAQYSYKIYPLHLRKELLILLNRLGVSILITGSNSKLDIEVKKQLNGLSNIFDMIGDTTLEEYFALSELSLAYIGMDTLNMHIAASQNKQIFAIFGPTNLKMWSPWSNQLKRSATFNKPKQSYGNITIFQANMPCVACGMAGCNNKNGKSECLDHIDPKTVFDEIKNWYQYLRL